VAGHFSKAALPVERIHGHSLADAAIAMDPGASHASSEFINRNQYIANRK
jgi:hypothetical protein